MVYIWNLNRFNELCETLGWDSIWLELVSNGGVVDESVVLLLVEEISITHVVVWIITCHWLWSDLVIRISEVDISHVVGIVKEIWIESIIVPEIVRIVLAFPMSLGHVPGGSSETSEYVGPHNWSEQVEPGVEWAHKLVVWMSWEWLICKQVWEGLLEHIDSMLHEWERAPCEDSHTWYGESSPVTIQILLNILVEDTISTLDGVSLDSFSEIAWLLWHTL